MPFRSEAWVVHEPGGPITLSNVEYSDPGPGELVIENAAFSVCASDLKAAKGEFYLKPPMILGHEASGIVKQVGPDVTSFKPGDRVVLAYTSCKACHFCNTGQNAYCDSLLALNFSGRRKDGSLVATTADGEEKQRGLSGFFFGQSSMSRLILASENSAVKVDARTDEELRLFAALGCGVQTGAGAVLNVLKPPPGSTIAIFGAGSVGVSAAYAASLTSPSQVILIDNSEAKLKMLPAGAATSTICSASLKDGEVAQKLLDLTDGKGVNFVVECAGFGKLITEGHAALAKRGTVLTVGGAGDNAEISVSKQLIKGATYKGTHQGDSVTSVFIPHLIDLWRRGKFPFDNLITHYSFKDLHQALADLKEGKIFKPVLVNS